ncbi:replication initiator [Streptomyces sp. NPDC001102]
MRASARRVLVRTPYSLAVGERVLRWGTQIDVRALRVGGDEPEDDAVAAYVAKYVTKGASDTGAGADHSLTAWADIETASVTDHVRTLMRTCWRLGGLPEYEPLRLRAWTHTLGYRGHILTKSRAYSTTYAALRAERAHHVRHVDLPNAITERQWSYAGYGHTPGAASSQPESPRTSTRVDGFAPRYGREEVGLITPPTAPSIDPRNPGVCCCQGRAPQREA